MKKIKHAGTEFGLLMVLHQSIHFNINTLPLNVISCTNASLTGAAALYYPFERFHEVKKSLVSSAYNV